jgi:hypothetical protein
MSKHRVEWSDAERALLSELWHDPKVAFRELRARIGKSESAIYTQAKHDGLPERGPIRGRQGFKKTSDKPEGPRRYLRGDRTIPLLPSEIAAAESAT